MNRNELWLAVYVKAVVAFAQQEDVSDRQACEAAVDLANRAMHHAISEGRVS